MSRIISALLVAFSSAVLSAAVLADTAAATKPPPAPLVLAPDAPARYTVVTGDTLWGVASRFVKDPYRWPDLWRLNTEQVKNPHRIYPGQVLVLKMEGDEPKLEVVRIGPKQYDEEINQAIPAIPPAVIEPFLDKPLVIEAGSLDTSARIIALEEQRLLVGAGSKIYVTGIKDQQKQSWQIFRPGKALIDPETKQVLGHEAVQLGQARLMRKGDPAILEVTNSTSEIGIGEHLLPTPTVDVPSYAPHAPAPNMRATVISVLGGLRFGGKYSVAVLSRGTRDGLEVGHVLALHQAGIEVNDRFKDKKEKFQLPEERFGLVFVFRVFDRVAYALVMEAQHMVEPGDIVKTP